MKPLAAVWHLGIRLRNTFFDRGWAPVQRLRTPVISIGNLSVGGSGKTPFTMLLGDLLIKRGLRVAVLSRGYGRATKGVAVVEPTGSSRDFGDEPLLIARRLKVPVVVAEERYRGGLLAEERFSPDVFLLDDGFQHRELARDFDICLVTPDDARDHLMPAGRLREPMSSLLRADAVALVSGAEAQSFPVAGKTLWRVRRGIFPSNVPPKPVVFCGIARPQNFFLQLRKAGIEPAAEAAFRDHHPYLDSDIDELLDIQRRAEADGFITTEKDAVNLGDRIGKLGRVSVIPVKMTLEDAGGAIDAMLTTIEQRRGVKFGTTGSTPPSVSA
jgi:tetraacyldisaccharide 4'-kinase